MNKIILAAVLGATTFVSACESAEVKAERLAAEQAALSVCPAEEVVGLEAFTLDLPALEGSAEAFHNTLAERDNVPTNEVRVNYHGVFPTGEKFDSSFDRGQPTEFPLNRVISGWTEGVGLMRPCDAWTFYIPSDLAYGPQGRPGIPGGASLVFHVQLLEVK